jgi:2-keto-4-pentenoate hydratase
MGSDVFLKNSKVYARIKNIRHKGGKDMEHPQLTRFFSWVMPVFVMIVFQGFSTVSAGDTANQLAEQYLKKVPVTRFDAKMTMEEAEKVQEEFVAQLVKEFGEPVGYKAGLTNPDVQKVFGVSNPVRGTLLKKMILQSGSVIRADFGARPMCEGDLIVRVGNEAINQAKTPEETLKYLDAVIPFIELPDIVYDKNVKLNGPALVAINVGARYGVAGEVIEIKATPEWRDRLKNFTLRIYDEKGALASEGKGSSLLGDPLNVVFWIKNSLAAEGKKLKKGDLLSLGSLTKMIPSKPASSIRASYIGLNPEGPVEITVTFK